jgi:hypothetical protein
MQSLQREIQHLDSRLDVQTVKHRNEMTKVKQHISVIIEQPKEALEEIQRGKVKRRC